MNKNVIKEIKNIDEIISKNIANNSIVNDRGLLSQNILGQLRTLIESISVLIYNKKHNKDLDNSYESKKISYNDIKSRSNPKLICDFHRYLQASKSHYTTDFDGAERLMQKYYYLLIKLKNYVYNEFNLLILENITDFPINMDISLIEYYQKTAVEINKIKFDKKNKLRPERYYVQKSKPFYIDAKLYYEITLSNGSDHINKFERVVIFSEHEVMSNYAIKISFKESTINIFGKNIGIKILDNWMVSIRSCEINNFSKILGLRSNVKQTFIEYNNFMYFLTNNNINLLDLALMPEEVYRESKKVIGIHNTNHILSILELSRQVILKKLKGHNVLRYLLYTMNNVIIKKQLSSISNDALSGLYLNKSCFSFDKKPFVLSLSAHIPKGNDLFNSIEIEDKTDEFLERFIKNRAENKGQLYVPLEDLSHFDNIDEHLSKFNMSLYNENQKLLELIKENNYIYMKGYEIGSIDIIKKINFISEIGLEGYKESYAFWKKDSGQDIHGEKDLILSNMFENSRISIIYGSAGTGKTTLISIFSDFFADRSKVFIANTNTAKENLKRKVNTKNCSFYTISEYISKIEYLDKSDVLIVDECSTVNNKDMKFILEKNKFELIMLVGDYYQIESINFGNWFYIAKDLAQSKIKYELFQTFRSKNENLLNLWKKVRKKDDMLSEYIQKNDFSCLLDNTIFDKFSNDEIILCLNYDGLYGINQINKYLQSNNYNKEFRFGINTYKQGDPILFTDTKRFAPVLYNNLKGKIHKIIEDDNCLWFEIEIEKAITKLDIGVSDVEWVGTTKNNNTIVKFYVNKEFEHDDDDDNKNNIIPFNISYAVSIHKAQGLEYDSVKIIITNDIEDLITSNIFYTAITRAKEILKIYWTPESQEKILKNIIEKKSDKDLSILKQKL